MRKLESVAPERFAFGKEFSFYQDEEILVVDNTFAAKFFRRPGKNLRLIIHANKYSSGQIILSDKVKELSSYPDNKFNTLRWNIDNLSDTLGITIDNKYLLIPQVVLTPKSFGMILNVKTDHVPQGHLRSGLLEVGEMDRILTKIPA